MKVEFRVERTLEDGTQIKEPYIDGKPHRDWMEKIVGPNWSKWEAYNSMRERNPEKYVRQ